MNPFNKKFGTHFIQSIPQKSGVYQIYNNQSVLIYVGKAKNLRRRLGNYKNAKRKKKHQKMKEIISEASFIKYDVCDSELQAHLLETKLIQSFRPKWNVVGAFYFMYPMIGMLQQSNNLIFIYTTQPHLFSNFIFHGAFRSREITRDAFFSLIRLMKYIGHSLAASKIPAYPSIKYSYVYGFRQLPSGWFAIWELFWKGESKTALELLILELVENAGARKNAQQIQQYINKLNRFWIHEAQLLKKVRSKLNYLEYPVSQQERDLVFLKYRYQTRRKIPGPSFTEDRTSTANRKEEKTCPASPCRGEK